MPQPINRREFFAGLAKTIGVLGAGAGLGLLGRKAGLFPPSLEGPYGLSDAVTFAAQRLFLNQRTLAREFPATMISQGFPVLGTANPKDLHYQALRRGDFAQWSLPVTGLVARPTLFSLGTLRQYPSRTQITQHICQEGWSAIAQWEGVPLWRILDQVGVLPGARYVVVHCTDGWWDSLDTFDALHPQTLLAYKMNGQPIPIGHGAPIRLRVERQLGYKSLKFVNSLTLTDRLDGLGNGKGSSGSAYGYAWYAGI